MSAATVAQPIRSSFFGQLSQAAHRLLLLDYDGTIAPFTVNRRSAVPYPSVAELLDCIMTTCRTRVVLISGRSAREIPPLLGIHPHPEIWGMHGFERLATNGEFDTALISDTAVQTIDRAAAWLDHEGLTPFIELKTAGVAVHWRGLDPIATEEVRTKAYRVLAPLACQSNLLLTEFDGGLEMRCRACTKDHAVRALLCEVEPETPVAYLGDDVTDEDAFAALNDRGLTVLVRSTPRPSAAQLWLRPPEELLQFLCDWVRASGGDM